MHLQRARQLVRRGMIGGGMLILSFLLPASIAQAAIPTQNLVAHWKFEEGSGSTAANSASSSYTGTLSNGPSWTTGYLGGGLTFSSTNAMVSVTDVAPINNVSQATLAGWIKRSASNAKVLFGKENTSVQSNFDIEAWDDGYVYVQVSNGSYAWAGVPLNDTNWHHVALVFDGTLSGNTNRMKMYVDGVLRTDAEYGGTVASQTMGNSIPFQIGKQSGSSSNGSIDEVVVYDRALTGTEVGQLFSDGGDTQAPTTPTNVSGSGTSFSTISLSWTTSTDDVGVAQYRVYRNGSFVTSTVSPAYTDAGLSISTSYAYTVSARDAAGNESAKSTTTTISTLSDTTAPTISISTPAANAFVLGVENFSATSADNVGVSGVKFFVDNIQIGTEDVTSPYGMSWSTTSVSDGTHSLTATARDAAGNVTTSSAITVTVNNTAPTVSLNASPLNVFSGASSTLTWSSTNATGCTASNAWSGSKAVSGNETMTNLQTTSTYTLVCTGSTGLTGNASVTVGVNAPPDTQAPTVPTGLSGSGTSFTTISLSWATSTDNVGVTHYHVFRNGNIVATTTAPSYSDSGLTIGTSYAYTVSARDAAGNESAQSATANVSTLSDTNAPTVSITSPATNAFLLGSVDIAATSTDNVGVVGVKFFVDGIQIGAEDTSSPFSTTWDTTTVSDATHSLAAVSRDAAGNTATSSGITVTVNNTAPTVSLDAVPLNVSAGASSTLTWSSTNATDCTASNAWSGSKALSGNQTFTNLQATSTFTLTCTGSTGLTGADSVTVGVTVTTDTQPPTVPTNLAVTTLTGFSLSLGWSTSTDANGVAFYSIYRDENRIATTTATRYTSSGLSASTTYAYRVSATDALGNESAQTASVSGTTMGIAPGFPLQISGDLRRILTSNGQPFLANAEAAWSLMVRTNREGVEQYLENRYEKGFNTILVELVEKFFGGPANVYGHQPFLVSGDFSTPNEAYFAHADWVIAKAAEKGFAVYLTPAYLGWGGGAEGWYQEVLANGDQKMYDYGRYLGNRYKDFDNIIWVMGGDYGPNDALSETRAIVQGIQDTAGPQIFTAHNSRQESGVTQYPANEPWINLNSTYSECFQTPARLIEDYNRPGPIPTIYLEGRYENEVNGASPTCVRSQAYWSFLLGANGHFFGNNPIWLFGEGWQAAMESTGSLDMPPMNQLFRSRAWSLLVPDLSNTVLTANQGNTTDGSYAAAARASDGSSVIVYTPSQRVLPISMSSVSGTQANAWWYNPRNGDATFIGIYSTTGSQSFTTPTDEDWVLVIDNAALELTSPGVGNVPTTDTVAPTVSITAPTASAFVAGSVSITASASDNVAIAGVTFLINGTQVGAEDTVSPYATTWNTTGGSDGSYALTAIARDLAGNVTTSSAITVTVNNTAPTVSLNASPLNVFSGASSTLTWSSTNATGCTASNAWSGSKAVSGNETMTNLQTTSTYTLVCTGSTGLTGNASVTVGVNAPPDTQAPTVPSSLTAGAVTMNTAAFSWSTSTDNIAVSGYKVFRGGVQVATTTVPSYTDSGLSASTTYAYTVSAFDAAGNQSAQSNPLNLTTSPASSIPTQNLVAHWKFEEGSGSTAANSASSSYTGTLSNGPSWTTGYLGGGLTFSSTNAMVSVTDVAPINNVSQATLAGWIKRSASNAKVLFGKENTSVQSNFDIEAWDDGYVYVQVSNGSYAWAGVPLNDTNWHHVALVFDGTLSGNTNRMKMYVDGVLRTDAEYGGTVASQTMGNSIPFQIGKQSGSSSNGSIDEVVVYDRALTAGDVAQLAAN